jgi:hypothetical protein
MIPLRFDLEFMLEGLVEDVPENQRWVVVDLVRRFRVFFLCMFGRIFRN